MFSFEILMLDLISTHISLAVGLRSGIAGPIQDVNAGPYKGWTYALMKIILLEGFGID